jgi:hypothetical protein
MAITRTKIDEDVWGKTVVKWYNLLLDSSYPTGGYKSSLGFNAAAFGLKSILGLQVVGLNALGSGVVAIEFDYTNIALMAFRVATFTPAGSIAVTDGAVTVVGGGIGEAIGINPDTNAGVLSKAAATTRTIPQATFGIAATTAILTGTAQGQVALAEVSNAVSLSGVTVRVRIEGR